MRNSGRGAVEINGEEVRTSSLSSFRRAREVAGELKAWVEKGQMQLALPTRPIDAAKKVAPDARDHKRPPCDGHHGPARRERRGDMRRSGLPRKNSSRGRPTTCRSSGSDGRLVGIVTTFDISKAVANPGKAAPSATS